MNPGFQPQTSRMEGDMRRMIGCSLLAFLVLHLLSASSDAGLGGLGKLSKAKQLTESDIGDVLDRIEATKTDFAGATKCLNQSRDVLFDIAATNEKKEQVKAKESALAAAENDEEKERITVEIQTMKDEEIERARKSGELKKKKLEGKQLKNTGRLMYNLALAVLKDKAAVGNAKKLKGEAPEAIKSAKSSKLQAAKGATKIKAVSDAVSKDLPTILAEAPRQIKTLKAFLSAAKALKKSNKVEDLGKPKEEDTFQELEF